MPAFDDSCAKALPSNETFDLLLYTRSDQKVESAAESLLSTKAGLNTTSTAISNPIARDLDNTDIVFWCRS